VRHDHIVAMHRIDAIQLLFVGLHFQVSVERFREVNAQVIPGLDSRRICHWDHWKSHQGRLHALVVALHHTAHRIETILAGESWCRGIPAACVLHDAVTRMVGLRSQSHNGNGRGCLRTGSGGPTVNQHFVGIDRSLSRTCGFEQDELFFRRGTNQKCKALFRFTKPLSSGSSSVEFVQRESIRCRVCIDIGAENVLSQIVAALVMVSLPDRDPTMGGNGVCSKSRAQASASCRCSCGIILQLIIVTISVLRSQSPV